MVSSIGHADKYIYKYQFERKVYSIFTNNAFTYKRQYFVYLL